LLFQNALVRVIEAKVPAGKIEPRHSHPHGLTVYLADYEVETKTVPDNKAIRLQRKFGTVTWSEAVVHEVRNVGKTAAHAIRIELK
jgi:anti-sigma factor RsiW